MTAPATINFYNLYIGHRLIGQAGRGSIVFCDSVLGSDIDGGVNMSPFATLSAALTAAASATAPCWIKLAPGNYAIPTAQTLPVGMRLSGEGTLATILNWTGTTAGPVLTCAGRNLLSGFTLNITGTSGSNLVGIQISGALPDIPNIEDVVINGATPATSSATQTITAVSIVYNAISQINTMRGITITMKDTCTPAWSTVAVSHTDGGFTGLLSKIRNSTISCTTASTGTTTGIITTPNVALSLIDLMDTAATAEITSASVSLVTFKTSTFTNYSFTNICGKLAFNESIVQFGASGTIASGTTYAYPGWTAPTATPTMYSPGYASAIVGLCMCARVGPGTGHTVQAFIYKNSAPTTMTVTLNNTDTTALTSSVVAASSATIPLASTDTFGVQLVTSASSTAADICIIVNLI